MKILCRRTFSTYQQAFQWARNSPNQYWAQQARNIVWNVTPNTALSIQKEIFYKYFPDGKLNITNTCLDQHLEQQPRTIAYHYESPITGHSNQITYQQLHTRVSKLAAALKQEFQIKPNDKVVIYMSMVVESVIAMLACARIGAVHVVVFGGFSAKELANRILDSEPKLVICTNAGKEPNKVINYLQIMDQALTLSKHQHVPKLIFHRPDLIPSHPLKPLEADFLQVENSGEVAKGQSIFVQSNHPLYVLYTSGTTGMPKGIVRDHGGTAVILKHALKTIFNLKPGDGMFCSSDIGWVLGHSFIVYGPLLGGLRSVLFQGKPIGTPNCSIFWNILEKHKINHLYTSPTAIRTIRKEDPEGEMIIGKKLDKLVGITVVGERCDIPTFHWIKKHFPNKFINDTYWQTETGSPNLSNFLGFGRPFDSKPGSACKPVPGYHVQVLNEITGELCKPNQTGLICLKRPLPPSFMLTMLNNVDKYEQKYFSKFKGYYNTGDSGYYDQEGYFYVMSRVDDIINTAGHRLSTGQMEEVIMKHPAVAEAIVIGVPDEIKGEVPAGFITVSNPTIDKTALVKEVVALVREEIGPVASFKICHIVHRLPKTRSGKYLRHVLRKIYTNQAYTSPPTIEDISVLHEIEEYIKQIPK